MSDVLFDAPGPRARARHRIYTVLAVIALLGILAWVIWRLYDTGQLTYEMWEPLLTPVYVEALLIDGLLVTLRMAVTAVLLATVFGLIFGVGKLSERGAIRWPAWLVASSCWS